MGEFNFLAVSLTVLGVGLAVLAWAFFVRRRTRQLGVESRRRAAQILKEADREAEAKLREAEVAAREKLLQARGEFEKASRKRRSELESLERRLSQKEENLDKRSEESRLAEKDLAHRETQLHAHEKEIEVRQQELQQLIQEQRRKLETIAGLSEQQAKTELIEVMTDEARLEAAHTIKRIDDEAQEQAARKAQWVLGLAVQRGASDFVTETTVSVVMLPSDEMKGRIIGREGRNIRALEMATGIDLIVDDTPEAVILSGFDPYRREIARESLQRLIADGRIHPARIEEVVERVKSELEERVQADGEAALLELNIAKVHPELVRLLGRLRYRTSYGQNQLQHSREVALLAATMAAEIKADVTVAKRAGILHDIGKSVDREIEGGHVAIGMDLLRRHGESEEVIHAMSTHHGDFEPNSVEAVLVTAADALSAARPGARREVLETYVKRLEKLEEIASSFKGVQKSFAIQAGREIRVIVDSQKLSDDKAIWLSRDIAKKIEGDLTYPGQIKVTVIRETRSIEYAR